MCRCLIKIIENNWERNKIKNKANTNKTRIYCLWVKACLGARSRRLEEEVFPKNPIKNWWNYSFCWCCWVQDPSMMINWIEEPINGCLRLLLMSLLVGHEKVILFHQFKTPLQYVVSICRFDMNHINHMIIFTK